MEGDAPAPPKPALPRGFKWKTPAASSFDESPAARAAPKKRELQTLDEAVDWVADGWAAMPGEQRKRKPVLPPPEPKPPPQPKKKPKAASSGAPKPKPKPRPIPQPQSSHMLPPPPPPPLPPPPPRAPREPKPPRFEVIVEPERVEDPNDPERWQADGWMAAPGVKRESKPVLAAVNEPIEKKRTPDPAAIARAAAVTAALVAGARVEARFQTSLNVPWKTHYFPGTIDAVNKDGTYNVRYDDGDYEPNVKRRYMRLLQPRRAAMYAAAAAGGSNAAMPPPMEDDDEYDPEDEDGCAGLNPEDLEEVFGAGIDDVAQWLAP